MRNWNLGRKRITYATPEKVCIVPMRNWNYEVRKSFNWFIYVCIVPMRNWNFDTSLHFPQRWNCLYRTYEELKHPKGGHSSCSMSVCIVPMRNWNRNKKSRTWTIGRTFVSYLWGIETRKASEDESNGRRGLYRTYEELKLMKSDSIRKGKIVCIVPMRNWNYRYIHRKKRTWKNRLYRTYEELKH